MIPAKGNVYYALVGLPATGKSTFREHLMDNFKVAGRAVVICSSDDNIDRYAAENDMTYNEAFLKYAKEATKEMESQRDIALTLNIDIIHDQTNLTVKKRAAWLAKIPDTWEKIAIYFGVEDDQEEEWKKRLASREGKVIPEHILFNMRNSFEMPDENEGFDAVVKLKNFG